MNKGILLFRWIFFSYSCTHPIKLCTFRGCRTPKNTVGRLKRKRLSQVTPFFFSVTTIQSHHDPNETTGDRTDTQRRKTSTKQGWGSSKISFTVTLAKAKAPRSCTSSSRKNSTTALTKSASARSLKSRTRPRLDHLYCARSCGL